MTKETAIVIPVLGFSYYYLIIKAHYFFRNEQMIIRSWLITLIVWVVLKQSVAMSFANLTIFSQSKDLLSNLTGLIPVLLQYLGKSILPVNLSPLIILHDTNLIYGLTAFIFLSTLLFFSKYKRLEYIIFGLIWFVFLILPFFVYKGAALMIIQENRLYLPIIGVGILILETDIIRKANIALLTGSLAIILLFSSITILYSNIYKDGMLFWIAVTEGSPSLPEGHAGLGNCYREEKEFDKAEQEYNKSIKLDPLFAAGWYNLSLVYFERGEISKAEQLCKKSIRIEPDIFEAYNFLGVLYLQQNKLAEAKENFQKSLSINPNYEDAISNLKSMPK
jgi:tetratricopeptide (TPR) repeat protein